MSVSFMSARTKMSESSDECFDEEYSRLMRICGRILSPTRGLSKPCDEYTEIAADFLYIHPVEVLPHERELAKEVAYWYLYAGEVKLNRR